MAKRPPRSRRVAHPSPRARFLRSAEQRIYDREFANPNRLAAHVRHLAELIVDPGLSGAWLPGGDVLDALRADAAQAVREGTLASRLLPKLATEEAAEAALEALREAFLESEDGPDGPDALALMTGGVAMEN